MEMAMRCHPIKRMITFAAKLAARSLTGHNMKKIRLDTQQQPAVRYLDGIPDVWDTIAKFVEQTKGNGILTKTSEQNEYWMLETINEATETKFTLTIRNSNIIGSR
jgi:putative protein kinase ArgK-like GTPase of G3E family